MKVVVINVETLVGSHASATAEGGMKNLALLCRLGGLRDDDNHFCVGATFMEESPNRDEVEYFPHIPIGHEAAAEAERLLVVEEIVLLEQAEHTTFRDHFHRVVQKEVGQLFIREGTVRCLIALVAPLSPWRGQSGGKGRIACHHSDGFFYQALLLGIKETRPMQRLPRQRREEFDAGTDGLRLQRIAKRQTQTEGGQFDCTFLQINPMDFL